MTFTHIVVDTAPGAYACRTLETARDLAQRFGAKLTAVSCAWPRMSFISAAFGSSVPTPWQTSAIENDLATTRSLFDRVLGGSGVRAEWCSGIAEPTRVMRDHALLADLAVMGPSDDVTYAGGDPADLAVTAGTPVLRLGRESEALNFDRVIVGWKDCREARRALHDALPILRLSTSVLVVGIGDEVRPERLASVVEHLGRHDVTAEHAHLAQADGVYETLAGRAKMEGAGLIVTGAYSHSRQSERILGGVTRQLLADVAHSWFLSH